MKIIEINKGIACRVRNTIYINKALRKYPRLRSAILEHEQNHTQGFALRDIMLDIELKELRGMKRDYYTFILKHPSSWIEFSPIKKYGNTVLFNLPLFFIWLIVGVATCAILFG